MIRKLLWMLAVCAAGTAQADVITRWDEVTGQLLNATALNTSEQHRVYAIVATAAFRAGNSVTHRYGGHDHHAHHVGGPASAEAAIAAAHYVILSALVPAQKPALQKAYDAELAQIQDAAQREAGLRIGEREAGLLLAERSADGAGAPESWRPPAKPGVYVPTTIPALSTWSARKPWLLTSAAQLRPAPPPALDSPRYARDYNEIKAVGAARDSARTPAQTEIARFWETHRPSIYHGLLRSAVDVPGRDFMQNARLFMAVAQAADDAAIAVFEAKYFYNYWRPITAIRNGDQDGNDATERDASWRPFIETPPHPEYPCAHCIFAATFGAVIAADLGPGKVPTLSTTSPTADGAARSWTSVDAFVQEVANARIYDGVHYRNSTEVGVDMGQKIGQLAVAKHLANP